MRQPSCSVSRAFQTLFLLPDSVFPSFLLSLERNFIIFFFLNYGSLYVGVVVFPFLGFENLREKKPLEAVVSRSVLPLPSPLHIMQGARGAPSRAHR